MVVVELERTLPTRFSDTKYKVWLLVGSAGIPPEFSGRIENERKRNKRLGEKRIAKQREEKPPAVVY